MSEQVEQATAAPGEKRTILERVQSHQVLRIVGELRSIGVPDEALRPIEEWAATNA